MGRVSTEIGNVMRTRAEINREVLQIAELYSFHRTSDKGNEVLAEQYWKILRLLHQELINLPEKEFYR